MNGGITMFTNLVPLQISLALVPILSMAQGTKEDYSRAAQLQATAQQMIVGSKLSFNWSSDGHRLSWRVDTGVSTWKFRSVDPATGQVQDAFDHVALAEQLGKATGGKLNADKLTLTSMDIAESGTTKFIYQGKHWAFDPITKTLSEEKLPSREIELVAIEDLRSRNGRGNEETILLCKNETDQPIDLQWIGFDGNSHSYGKLAAGESTQQSTYVGHRWKAVANGQILAAWQMPKDANTAIIRGPVAHKPRKSAEISPDGKWSAYLKNGNVMLCSTAQGSEPVALATGSETEPYQGPVQWSPDSSHLITFRSRKVEQRMVTLIESSPEDQIQPKVRQIPYTKPGDPLPQPKPRLFDVGAKREVAVDSAMFSNPWDITDGAWSSDSQEYSFVYNQRGHQVMRILAIKAKDGTVRTIHEESSKTFLDYSQKYYFQRLSESREIVWMSERDGWNHLYLIDEATGNIKKQITQGEWNVREVVSLDAEKRTILFRGNGMMKGQDPYYSHYARVNIDGSGFALLTEANGDHFRAEMSPDGHYFIDQWSRVDQPPVAELRDAKSGKRIAELNRADDASLRKTGWSPMEAISAKGRDGKTDIYGVVIKPTNFDPAKKYPVIEHIYSGPHSFFVPKQFQAWGHMNELAELGFVVVMIDGMGTNWRGVRFHDVAWKNLSDAGLPDHMAWLKSVASTRPWMDLTRVGIYGGSAGGQNALSALLNQGDFYKAAVADCGCHDNRMDKIWWNEAWMGWPIDESYERNSNVVNAAKLKGKLMLIVGEVDSNVDPSSTLQVANALEKADKDFDLVIITGSDHGAAESNYGRRRRADFFVRHLLGVEPRSR